MKTKFIEFTNDFNWGKFLVGEFEPEEWARQSQLDEALGERLLSGRGWGRQHFLVLDLQTGEGAMFMPVGSAHHDLCMKHQVWVCPMFEPFLLWLYEQPLDDIESLPSIVTVPRDSVPSALQGYRRRQEYVEEGWWHPNVKGGQVHDHKPGMPMTMHRTCEPVFTKREAT